MSVKSFSLVAVALILAYLVYLDYGGGSQSALSVVAVDAWNMGKFQKLAGIVNSEQAINNAYGQMALTYAQRIAQMDTFVLEKGEPSAQMEAVVRQLAKKYEVTVEQLNIGTPQMLSDGVFWMQADIEMSSLSNSDTWSILLALAEHQHGFIWKSFKLQALVDEKKTFLSGQFSAVLVQAVE